MTTPEAVLLTQIPIALGCFWLAWELRRLRRSLERYLGDEDARGGAGRPDPGPSAGEEGER